MEMRKFLPLSESEFSGFREFPELHLYGQGLTCPHVIAVNYLSTIFKGLLGWTGFLFGNMDHNVGSGMRGGQVKPCPYTNDPSPKLAAGVG
jgi:hypothetical protein